MTDNNKNPSPTEAPKAAQDKKVEKKDTTTVSSAADKKEKSIQPVSLEKTKSSTTQKNKAKISTPKPTGNATNVSNDKKSSSNKIAILALVIALIGTGGSLYLTHQKQSELEQQIVDLRNGVASSQSRLESQVVDTQNTIKEETNTIVNRAEVTLGQHQESIESLQVALADVKGRRPNDWLLAEADYLVKLASRKLLLERDLNTAIGLMESADQRIATLNDPSLLPLRQVINDDLTKLKSTAVFDKDGLALKLMSLQKQVDTLPLANAIVPEQEQLVKAEVSGSVVDWQDNLMTSLQSFSEQFITFRTREGSAVPLLSPQQHFYLRENIKAKIEMAISATYTEKQEIFNENLALAKEWANTYLNISENKVIAFNRLLDELTQTDVTISYPSSLDTQAQLEDVIKQRLRREVTTISTEDNQ